jgi:hypothetical protein
MIEAIMYFGIGFLVATLLGLLFIPPVHNRAVRLAATTRTNPRGGVFAAIDLLHVKFPAVFFGDRRVFALKRPPGAGGKP